MQNFRWCAKCGLLSGILIPTYENWKRKLQYEIAFVHSPNVRVPNRVNDVLWFALIDTILMPTRPSTDKRTPSSIGRSFAPSLEMICEMSIGLQTSAVDDDNGSVL